MLGRSIANRAAHAGRLSSARAPPMLAHRVAGKRFASSSSSSSGGSAQESGPSSMLVATGLLGGVLAVGYLMGRNGTGRPTSVTSAAEPATKSSSSKKKDSSSSSKKKAASESTPKKIVQKAGEAAESVKSSSSSDNKATKKEQSTSSSSSSTNSTAANASVADPVSSEPAPSASSSSAPSDEDQEDPSQAAFNPETGEINWDCPCLGGMAHGVCGEEFKAAFSCFIYSQEEPKGQDCIEKFRGMQECFRAHPEVYGEEVAGDDSESDELGATADGDAAEYDIISAVEAALESPEDGKK